MQIVAIVGLSVPSFVILAGTRLLFVGLRGNALAAFPSRFRLRWKSPVFPALPAARYSYIHTPSTRMYVSSMRQEPPKARAYRFRFFSNSGV